MDNAATVYGGQTAVQPSRKSFELGRLAPPPELASPFFHQSVPIHVAGRGFGKQPGQAMDTTSRLPFTSTVSGMSMKLASLNTKFSQDFLHSEASQQRGAHRVQLASAASSELSDSMGGRDPLITILGGQRSVGNWWSQDDLSALPMEHVRASRGEMSCLSDDGFESLYSRAASCDGVSQRGYSSNSIPDLALGC
eukprot:jgi/Tetstr1/459140/TSEL_004587.t1